MKLINMAKQIMEIGVWLLDIEQLSTKAHL